MNVAAAVIAIRGNERILHALAIAHARSEDEAYGHVMWNMEERYPRVEDWKIAVEVVSFSEE